MGTCKKIIPIILLFLLSCNKFDNSELMQRKVMFINQNPASAEVNIVETGSTFILKSGDSLNYPISSGQASLFLTYKPLFIHDGIVDKTGVNHVVIERNIIR